MRLRNDIDFSESPCINMRASQKVMALFYSTGIITNIGTCIIHPNEAGLLLITSLLLNIVTVSLTSNVPVSIESIYPCFVKFCWLFFEPLHHWCFHFLLIGCLLNPLSWGRRDDKHFASVEKVKTAVMKWLKEQSTKFYEAEIQALIWNWNIATERNGDYVENQGCDQQTTSFIWMFDTCSYVGNYSCTTEKCHYLLTHPHI